MNEILRPKIIVAHRIYRGLMFLMPIMILCFIGALNDKDPGSFFVACFFTILFAFPVFMLSYLNVVRLRRLTYTLNPNGITTHYKFIGSCSVTVYYKDIKEISMVQGIFQRKFNVGSINITTNATKENAGFEIYNIENYQEVYDFLIKKIAECSKQ